VVDDDVSVLGLVREAFSQCEGVELHATPSPIYAFELALKLEVNLFIFDYFMPGLTAGLLHTLIMKTYENWRPLARHMPPLLLMSGRGDPIELRELLAEPGVIGILPKPFTPQRLIERTLPILQATSKSGGTLFDPAV
jgi:CheY-like chemotaxis protein